MSKTIFTPAAPAPIGPYTQAQAVGNTLYCSGQIGLDPATGELVAGGIVEQTQQVLKNLQAVLEAAGVGPEAVVKTTCLLADIADFPAFNDLYATVFSTPARSTFAVKSLPKAALVEVEVIAAL
ncbi:Rid family detoxifying hydrolase [Lacticaseibacillus daqingensis]|uniref:Rid family detoxifying hydrolase n=1 Tax=Lacticaseibacillus daqingensis TaxID=2486014 RepID=UPI000F79D751|nr:Rid family detoxifying hydrolase [Lacticaseibacillus daqingensis]